MPYVNGESRRKSFCVASTLKRLVQSLDISVMDNISFAGNINIQMKWWPRRDGTSRHIWVPVNADEVFREAWDGDEMECVATNPGVCPCGKVQWIGVA